MADRKYAKTDEWVTVEGDIATVGISQYAQAQLGDIVFIELPKIGAELKAGESFGVIESVKAASDMYAPVSGTVAEVNESVRSKPETVNADATGEGWMLKIKVSGSPASDLMDEAGYNLYRESTH